MVKKEWPKTEEITVMETNRLEGARKAIRFKQHIYLSPAMTVLLSDLEGDEFDSMFSRIPIYVMNDREMFRFEAFGEVPRECLKTSQGR